MTAKKKSARATPTPKSKKKTSSAPTPKPAAAFGVGADGVFLWDFGAGVARAGFFLAVMVELHG